MPVSSTPVTWRRTYRAKHQQWSWGGRCSCETQLSVSLMCFLACCAFFLTVNYLYQPCTIHFSYLRGRQDVSEVICWGNARTRVMFSTRYAKSRYFVSQREVMKQSPERLGQKIQYPRVCFWIMHWPCSVVITINLQYSMFNKISQQTNRPF